MLVVDGPHERFIVGCDATRLEHLDIGLLTDVENDHVCFDAAAACWALGTTLRSRASQFHLAGRSRIAGSMKHATPTALETLSDLLDQIRGKTGIKEKKLGIFYRRSKSFLHFHEDPAGLFGDLSVGKDFERYPVNTRKEWKALLSAIDRALQEDDQC